MVGGFCGDHMNTNKESVKGEKDVSKSSGLPKSTIINFIVLIALFSTISFLHKYSYMIFGNDITAAEQKDVEVQPEIMASEKTFQENLIDNIKIGSNEEAKIETTDMVKLDEPKENEPLKSEPEIIQTTSKIKKPKNIAKVKRSRIQKYEADKNYSISSLDNEVARERYNRANDSLSVRLLEEGNSNYQRNYNVERPKTLASSGYAKRNFIPFEK